MTVVFRLHGISKTLISHQEVKFTSTFWKALFIGLGTQIKFSIAYHSHMDGKTTGNSLIPQAFQRDSLISVGDPNTNTMGAGLKKYVGVTHIRRM